MGVNMLSLEMAKRYALERAKNNKRITKESLKNTFEEVWKDMFEELPTIESGWKELAFDEYYNGYLDGVDDELSNDNDFDWDNITQESVTNWFYWKGVQDRYDDICNTMLEVEEDYDYACCLETDRRLGK